MKSRLIFSVLLIFLLLSPVFAGGRQGQQGDNVVLRFAWWGADARHRATLAAMERYSELNPHVRLEGEFSSISGYYQNLVTQFAGGTAPDIIQMDYPWLTDFDAQGRFLVDFNNYAHLVDLSAFDRDYLMGWCSVGGRLEGVPFALNAYTMFFNRRMVERAGIDLNTDSLWSWSKLLSEGDRFVARFPDYIFLHSDSMTLEKNIFKPFLMQINGGQFINDDLTLPFSRADVVRSYQFMLDLLNRRLIQPLADTASFDGRIDQNPIWANGRAALVIRWASDLIQLMNPNVDVHTARLPVIEGAWDSAINTKPSMIATVNARSRHIEEAMKFINWIILDPVALDIVTDVRGVPAAASARNYLSARGRLTPALVQSIEVGMAHTGTPQNGFNDNAEITSISVDIMNRVLFRSITPEQGADEFMRRVNDRLREMRN
jgi:oligogalacturonide transport system substrate-binding protein